jgi:PAS domain S-box-containing protein
MSNIKTRYALGAAIALTGALIAIGIHWRLERKQIKNEAAMQLTAIADLKRAEIANWRNERLADGRFFSQAPFVVLDVEAMLANPHAEPAHSNALKWLSLLKGGDRYAQIRIFRPDCSELVSVASNPSLDAMPSPEVINVALAAREPQLTDLHVGSDGELHLDVLVPIFSTAEVPSPSAAPPKPIAAIIMRLDPRQFLFPNVQKWPLPSLTAETVLAHREGEEVVYLNKLRHRSEPASGLRFPIGSSELPMAIAMRGKTGLIEGRDYRGVPVLAFVGPIPNSPWFMAAKVDQAEIYAPLRQQALNTGGMALTLALAILGSAGWLWRRAEAVYLRRELASETARLASEIKYRHYVEDAPLAIAVLDGDGRFVEVNPAACSMSGFTPEELSGSHFKDLLVPECREPGTLGFQAIKQTGSGADNLRLLRKDGVTRDVSGSCVRLSDDRFLAFCQDVTLQRQAEQAVRENEQRLRTLGDNIPGGAIYQLVAPPDGVRHFAYMSAGIEKIFGIPAGRILEAPEDFWQFIVEEDRFRFESEQARSARELTLFDCEFRQRAASGEVKWVNARSTPRRMDDGTVVWDGVVADITERKRVEVVMKEQLELQERIAKIATTVPGVIYTFRVAPDGVASFPYASPAMLDYFGFEASVVAADASLIFGAIHEDDITGVQASITDSARTLSPWSREFRYHHPKKGLLWVLAMSVPQREADGSTLWHGFTMEVTDLRKTQAALHASEERLRTTLDDLMEGCQILCFDWRYLYLNKAAVAYSRQPREKLIGRTMMDVYPDLEKTDLFASLRDVMEKRVPQTVETHFIYPDGESAWFQNHIQPVPEGIFVFSLDISGRKNAEEALERERGTLKTLVQTLPDLVWLKDPNGVYLSCNPRFEQFYGATESEIVGKTDFDFTSVEQANAFRENDQAAIRSGGPTVNTEELIFASDGHREWVETIKMPMFNAQKQLVGVLGISRDITASRLAQATIISSEKRFRDIASSMAGWVWETDAQGFCTFASDTVETILGYKPDEVIGKTSDFFMAPEEAQRVGRIAGELIATKSPMTNFETWKRHKDGHMVCLLANALPVLDGDGALLGYRGVDIDITERKHSERALQESQARFSELAENVTEVFWVSEPDRRRLLYVSPAYERIWGRTCNSVYADPLSWKTAIHPNDRKHVDEAVSDWTQTGNSEQSYRILRPDGSERWILDRAFPVRDASGKIIRIVGVAQDVTESRKLESQFRHAQKMEAIGQLAGGVAHDFNNILSVITIHTDLLTAKLPKGDPTRESLVDIQRAADRAAALTRQLLAFSRRQVVEPKVIELNSAVADSEKMLRRLIGEDVHLETALHPGLRAVKIDPGQLGQVIMNLAVNARDAMPRGGQLTIETHNVELDETYARAHAETKPGSYVLLAVTDTGCGMDGEVLAHIWEPFFTTKGAGRGTGLGLSVVHGIVKQANGHLSVYSECDIGTTFKIYLPAVAENAQAVPGMEKSTMARGHETILLADDEDHFRKVTAMALEHLGYTVLQASGGEQTQKLAMQHTGRIDLLLTDVVMPGMGGRMLAESLQASHPHLKVLYQSGYTDDAVVRHGILHAEVAFLQKPFTLASLAAKVREVLDG